MWKAVLLKGLPGAAYEPTLRRRPLQVRVPRMHLDLQTKVEDPRPHAISAQYSQRERQEGFNE